MFNELVGGCDPRALELMSFTRPSSCNSSLLNQASIRLCSLDLSPTNRDALDLAQRRRSLLQAIAWIMVCESLFVGKKGHPQGRGCESSTGCREEAVARCSDESHITDSSPLEGCSGATMWVHSKKRSSLFLSFRDL